MLYVYQTVAITMKLTSKVSNAYVCMYTPNECDHRHFTILKYFMVDYKISTYNQENILNMIAMRNYVIVKSFKNIVFVFTNQL